MNDKIEIGKYNDVLFRTASESGCLKIVEWLYEIQGDKIDFHEDNEFAFRNACLGGYYDIADWLWEKSNQTIDVRIMSDYLFKIACDTNDKLLIEYLCDKIHNYFYDFDETIGKVLSSNIIKIFDEINKAFDQNKISLIENDIEIYSDDAHRECLLCLDDMVSNNIISVCFNEHYYCIECYISNHKKK